MMRETIEGGRVVYQEPVPERFIRCPFFDQVEEQGVVGLLVPLGRVGLTAEQVLRCCILKQYRQLSYEELAFHLDDSSAFRGFSRLEMGQYPCKSILQENSRTRLAKA